jgi:type 1 fimbria pilin
MAMNSKKTVSVFFSIALVGAWVLAGPVASAAESALRFHGRIVNAGCDARILDAARQADTVKALKVSENLTVELAPRDDACGGALTPVSAVYVERSSVVAGERIGVVTLNYQ